VFAQAPRTAKMVLEASRASALALVLSHLISAALPLAIAWLGKLIIDGVVLAMQTGAAADRDRVLMLVIAELGLMVVSAAMSRSAGLMRGLLGVKLGYLINIRILEKALTLDLAHFEDPVVYDLLQNARREASSRPLNVFMNTAGIVRDAITLASFGAVLAAFSPIIVLVLIATTIPSVLAEARLSQQAFQLFSWRAPEGRRMKYLEWLLTRDTTVKEVKLYGLGDLILERYRAFYQKFFGEERSLAVRRATWGFALGTLATLGFYGAYAWIVVRTVAGGLTLGEMTMYLTIFRQGQGSLRSILSALSKTYEDNLFMSNLFAFLDLPTRTPKLAAEVPQPAPITEGFVLEDVWFRYPGGRSWALEGVDLTIGPREKIAIIGDNGAGKTTLIKLLTGLYPPTKGVIRLDGRLLADYAPNELRARIGVVLQDYVRYQFDARDNVGLGAVDAMHDEARIDRAAERGGAKPVVDELADGWDTQLGRWFEGGVELSAGQWQKLAVSRAFMRDAPILVLDEPTASLDAEAEHALFERLRALADDKMAILISHRFSTVRMADRIVVLRAGKVEEEGSHDALLATEGRYAHLFRLQASGYLDAFN